jgi:hypothetical protein
MINKSEEGNTISDHDFDFEEDSINNRLPGKAKMREALNELQDDNYDGEKESFDDGYLEKIMQENDLENKEEDEMEEYNLYGEGDDIIEEEIEDPELDNDTHTPFYYPHNEKTNVNKLV